MERAEKRLYQGDSIDSLSWSVTEKKIARKVFDMALQREFDAIIQKVKRMALGIEKRSDLWEIEDFLTRSRKAIDSKYDYRYSQLPFVFGQLARTGLVSLEDLTGLAEEKLVFVRLAAEGINGLRPGKRKL
jgi:Photoprotection regulator fluorescence recovery protein